jgi:hypothetical protein
VLLVFTVDEYFYQPCIYKFLCLKSIDVYAICKKYFKK